MRVLTLAGKRLPSASENVRRYCGLPWSGGNPEVWAYAYFDVLRSKPDTVEPVDVVATAALHPKLTRSDLKWFVERRSELEAWLSAVPDLPLSDVDPAILDDLPGIAGADVQLSLLTKVLHRKRPHLIPMHERRLLDWYRFEIVAKGVAAWPELTRALSADLAANRDTLAGMQKIVGLSHLRLADIAIWMEGA